VSERLLNVGRVSATGQQQGGVRVPEIMPAYRWQPCLLAQRLEEPVDYVLCVEGSTLARGKYES
jgi:hypothetical protein